MPVRRSLTLLPVVDHDTIQVEKDKVVGRVCGMVLVGHLVARTQTQFP